MLLYQFILDESLFHLISIWLDHLTILEGTHIVNFCLAIWYSLSRFLVTLLPHVLIATISDKINYAIKFDRSYYKNISLEIKSFLLNQGDRDLDCIISDSGDKDL